MKVVSEIIYSGLEASKNLETDATKTVDAVEAEAGGASIFGVFSEGGSTSLTHSWPNGLDTTTWIDLKLPPSTNGANQNISTPSLLPGQYLMLGTVGVWTTSTSDAPGSVAPIEVQIRAYNGTDATQWAAITLALADEIEQLPFIMPATASVTAPWRLQARLATDISVGTNTVEIQVEVNSNLTALTTDDNSFTKNIPSRIPSNDYIEAAVGIASSSWANQINDDGNSHSHIYALTFTTPASTNSWEHLFGIGDDSNAQMFFLSNTFRPYFGSGHINDGFYVVGSSDLSASTTYSLIIYVDAANNNVWMWIKAVNDPLDISVLDSVTKIESNYTASVHATHGVDNAWVKYSGGENNYHKSSFSTQDFSGDITSALRIYIDQNAQGV